MSPTITTRDGTQISWYAKTRLKRKRLFRRGLEPNGRGGFALGSAPSNSTIPRHGTS